MTDPRRLIAMILALVQFAGAAMAADGGAPALTLKDNAGEGAVNRFVSAALETGDPLSIEEAREAKFNPIATRLPDFGYYEKGIWLKIEVENPHARAQERIFLLHTNFMSELDVFHADGDSVDRVLAQQMGSVFASRPIRYHQPVAPIVFAPESRSAIYVRYSSEGNTVLPLSLETPVSFAAATNARVTVDFVFYGVMAMFVLASLIGRLFWANPTFLAYSLYAGSVLLYIFQRDGYAFQYLWPNAPYWNNFSSLPIGASLPLFAAFFTRIYLNTKNLHPVIDKILIAVVVMQIGVVASTLFIGASDAKKLAVLTTTISIILFFVIGVAAYLKYGRRTLFFVIGWLGILSASIVMTLVHWAGLDVSRAQSLDVMRGAMVFDALMLGLASLFSIVELQRDREKLSHERVEALSSNLELHNRLARLEQKHHLAQTLAERSNKTLMDTTHDLRQPLYALRAAMANMDGSNASSAHSAEIVDSLSYIEDLVEAALDQAVEEGEVEKSPHQSRGEAMRVDKLFTSLETMFRQDAAKNAVRLAFIPSTREIRVAPFPVLRIMANFLSNAIRYAPGERVTVGARRRGAFLSLEVHDTGPGIEASDLADLRKRFHRGDASSGDDNGVGLGLAIVDELACENDLEWRFDSVKGAGTVAMLIVPLTNEEDDA